MLLFRDLDSGPPIDLEGEIAFAVVKTLLAASALSDAVFAPTHPLTLKVVPFKPTGKTATLSVSICAGLKVFSSESSLEAPTHPHTFFMGEASEGAVATLHSVRQSTIALWGPEG